MSLLESEESVVDGEDDDEPGMKMRKQLAKQHVKKLPQTFEKIMSIGTLEMIVVSEHHHN